jgi:Tfp pilus assembly protein PilF
VRPRRARETLALALAGGLTLAMLDAASGCAHFVILNDPLSAAEHNDLGVAYETRGETDLARAQYQAALKRDPSMVRARVNLGNVEAARGEWGHAEKCYRRALADSANDADALNNLATALLRQSRHPEEAVSLAERAVAIGGERDSLYRSTLNEARSAARSASRTPSRNAPAGASRPASP